MAKVQPPPEIEIAALRKQVKQVANLMTPGSGTPWEDRGTLGSVKAFFVTAMSALFSPSKLLDQIRRPETTGDATAFAIGCGIVAGISWVVHSLAWNLVSNGYHDGDGVPPLIVRNNGNFTVNWQLWALGSALQLVAAPIAMVLLLRLANLLYQKMLPHAAASKTPDPLTYNVLAYMLGAALLSLIPCFGWLLALIWLVGLVVTAGLRRLALPASAAVINGVIVVIVTAAVGYGIYFAIDLAWSQVTGTSVQYTPPPPPRGSM